MVNVAINGFGRIGRNTLRAAIKEGIYAMIDKYLQDEEEENLIEAKWNEVKENV